MAYDIKSLIEAALFASGRTLTLGEIAKLCGVDRKKAGELLAELRGEYSGRGSGIELYELDGGYGMRVVVELEPSIMHLVPEADMPKSVLKILALIAHDEPVKQSDLVKARGNRVYNYLRKLREMGLVEAKKSGRTSVLKTTPKFREYFHIDDVKSLREK